ncbi:MAG: hypothetical protein QM784_32315 [Polyangiaceae bacterium]
MRLLFALLGCGLTTQTCDDDIPFGRVTDQTRHIRARSQERHPATGSSKPSPLRMEILEEGQRPEVYVLRGGAQGPGKLVFLHGMCGHGLGYAQAFQYSAAKKGTLIAPQGDLSCGGPWSKWSSNISALDARIQTTFRKLGFADPIVDVVVIGMSQGATRAEALARNYPKRYTRLISMAAPTSLRPFDLPNLDGAVLMAGERDRRDLMRASERALKSSGVPAQFMLIPEATHGAMGPTPELTMGAALDWLWQNAKRAEPVGR